VLCLAKRRKDFPAYQPVNNGRLEPPLERKSRCIRTRQNKKVVPALGSPYRREIPEKASRRAASNLCEGRRESGKLAVRHTDSKGRRSVLQHRERDKQQPSRVKLGNSAHAQGQRHTELSQRRRRSSVEEEKVGWWNAERSETNSVLYGSACALVERNATQRY